MHGRTRATRRRTNPSSPPAPANDDAAIRSPADPADADARRTNPSPTRGTPCRQPVRAELDRLLAADDWPGLARLAATGALLPLGLEPADLASPAALGRALFRPAAAPGKRARGHGAGALSRIGPRGRPLPAMDAGPRLGATTWRRARAPNGEVP